MMALWFGLTASGEAAQKIATINNAGWAAASLSDFPDPTPEYTWWSLGWNQKLTTSHCIGKNTSPLCVVETALACKTRKKIELCRIARKDPDYWDKSFERYPGIPYPHTGLIVYRLNAVTRLEEKTMAEFIWAGNYMWGDIPPVQFQEGDILIDVFWNMCGKASNGKVSDCCLEHIAGSMFIMRKIAAEWILLWDAHPTQGRIYKFSVSPGNEKIFLGKDLPNLPSCESINVSAARPGPAIKNYRQWLRREPL